MGTNNFLANFILDDSSISDTIFMEKFGYSIDILIVAISAEAYPVFAAWLLRSLCD